MNAFESPSMDYQLLKANIKTWAHDLGFGQAGVSGIDLSIMEPGLLAWLEAGYHGEMDYMARHGLKRARPAELVPGTLSIISCRMNYVPANSRDAWETLKDGDAAYISRYALGRDYHKVLRNRLQKLADKINKVAGPMGFRVFTDSAPVMEVQLASQAGNGWRGKHTLLLSRDAGSMFFLGEIFTDLPLPADDSVQEHCGRCTRCIDICPTQAIVAPYQVDARRCISYLTIELHGPIPVEFRPMIGNRVYGCDDCQLTCPWNRFAQHSTEPDFAIRNGLDSSSLIDLFAWTEEVFQLRMAGSAIYRIGYERWLRNLAVGLGNAPSSPAVIAALQARADDPSPLVREHVNWSLAQHVLAANIESQPTGEELS
ncbi:tRNA epoxyqueuosine(34) reductase QueG [Chitinivorax sp. B]|uniref:tRNA epoxyqueuosine(34) reductase QueG n=1 Tax=Chitinivorax sp. B TaxID=2502235 RepID=UPI002016AD33|nr:tRNA epoxyqueuosine(34) reductase QueG [Chitinivorax sp. B]